MKKQSVLAIYFGLLILLLSSCTSDGLSDLTDVEEINTATYTNNVKTIIYNNCVVCHGTIPANGAPMSLTTYEKVKEAVLNRGLLDRISRSEGTSGAMPYGGPRLPQTSINIINQWNTDGLKE